MGCTASKLDNEDTVRRCKERRGLMKQAVDSRHHLSSAHTDYLRSLRLTGVALSRFASGEPLTVSDDTPPVLLRATSAASSAPSSYVPAPTPPPPVFMPPSPTIASSKLPHILSESSPPPTSPRKYPSHKYPYFPSSASNYSTTPSQSSSVWNWENFYPPSPPSSDFYRNKAHGEHTYNEDDDEEKEEEEEEAIEQEEVHCSEWFEHDGSHSSSSSLSDDEHETSRKDSPARSEAVPSVATRSNYAPSSSGTERVPSMRNVEEKSAKGRSDAGSTIDGEISNMRMVVRHRNLAEIVKAIEEYFEKAAGAGGPVSDLLETGRAQFDRSFRQLKSE